jgi:hypothetical protein
MKSEEKPLQFTSREFDSFLRSIGLVVSKRTKYSGKLEVGIVKVSRSASLDRFS